MRIHPTVTMILGAELPNLEVWWRDGQRQLIDFTAGWTFEARVGKLHQPAVVVKTTGIIGAAGSGTPSDGTPNVTIVWDLDELDGFDTSCRWVIQINAAAADQRDRKAQIGLKLLPEVAP